MRIAIPSNASQGLATSLIVRTTLSVGRFCLVGVILALGVPAIAWLEQSALLLLLGVVVVVGIGAALWWRYTKESAPAQ